MSKNNDIAALNEQYVMKTYSPGVTLVKGKGVKVIDADHATYYDFTGGIAVQNTGHCHPKVVKAIQDQAETLVHCSNLFFNPKQALLGERLVKLSGLGGKAFFCNSGAEANEAMVKLARLWGHENGKFEVISMQGSFHGRTLGMISATGQSKVQKGYDPLLMGFVFAEYNNLESVKALINERTVAILLEPIQGEGGVISATPDFVKGVRTLCDQHGLMMLVDDIQCGMGRTGKWFGWQHFDVTPDAFTLAKALASGVPIGAMIASSKYADVFTPGTHGSTFGGNPLATAAALATIDVIEKEGLVEKAESLGQLFREALQQYVEKYDDILEVRGQGLLVGLVVKGSAKSVVEALCGQGLLACIAGEHVVRFVPPLVITEKEFEEAMDMVADALDALFGTDDAEAQA